MTADRNTGRTAQQMCDAPQGATFVWCNERTDYPKDLARFLGRSDLRIVPLSWLRTEAVLGRDAGSIVLDHAVDRQRLSDSAGGALVYMHHRATALSNAEVKGDTK